MSLVIFYQLSRSPVDATARQVLDRALAAGWRVMLRGTDHGRLESLDAKLWLGAQDAFLAHGLAGGAQDADQPVLLGTGPIANAAQALMLVDGAETVPAEIASLNRVWILFDGADDAALAQARLQWKSLTGAGIKAQYWSETGGSWEKKAES